MRLRLALPALMLAMITESAVADTWGVQIAVGAAYNLPTSLTIRQEGAEQIHHHAHYTTRGFRFPLYYAIRATYGDEDGAWALELRHHKLFLDDPPAEVQEFEVSHGYNLLQAIRLWRDGDRVSGLGAGVVIAHPENVVRGRALEPGRGWGGYVLGGPVVSGLFGYDVPLADHLKLPLEGMISAAWARLPVAGGSADVPNVAAHGTIGISWR